jgi:hypothetical protein
VDGRVELRATGVSDKENGCLDPETEAGDVSCAGSAGELSGQLVFGISVYPPTGGECLGPTAVTQSVTIDDLQSGLDLGVLGAETTRCVGVQVRWPDDPGAVGSADRNRANGDEVSFDLLWTLTQVV